MNFLNTILNGKRQPKVNETFEQATLRIANLQQRHQLIKENEWLIQHLNELYNESEALLQRVCVLSTTDMSNEEFACIARALAVQAHTLRKQYNKLTE